MSFAYDPEFAAVIAPLAEALTANPAPAGDWKTLRETGNAGLALLAEAMPDVEGADRCEVEIPVPGGATIPARLYRKAGAGPAGSAILYIHGGGMVLGSMDLYDKGDRDLCRRVGRAGAVGRLPAGA